MNEVFSNKEQFVRSLEVIPVVDSAAKHELLPLTVLSDIKDFGFDVEDTVIGQTPRSLAVNFVHFLRYQLAKGRGETLDPREYLETLPRGDKKSASSEKYAEYKRDAWGKLVRAAGDEAMVRQAVHDFIFVTHSDEARGQAAATVLGMDVPTLWGAYGDFWKAIAPDAKEADSLAVSAPLPGAVELLNLLAKNGKRIHFITNADGTRIESLLEQLQTHGFEGAYSLVSARDVGKPKPHPAVFQALYEKLDIHPLVDLKRRVPFAYFGNAISDVLAGENAGAAIIGLVNPLKVEGVGNLPPFYQMRNLQSLHDYLVNESIFA